MKRVRYMYWAIAIIGFLLPVSRMILMQTPTLFSTLFLYVLSFGFKTKDGISLIEISGICLSLITLFLYLYHLIRLNIECTKNAKKSYVIVALLYSVCGSVYLLSKQPSTLMVVITVCYFIVLSTSTYFVRAFK